MLLKYKLTIEVNNDICQYLLRMWFILVGHHIAESRTIYVFPAYFASKIPHNFYFFPAPSQKRKGKKIIKYNSWLLNSKQLISQ